MIPPPGLTEDEVVEILTRISGNLADQYTFGSDTREDIIQQGIFEGLKCIAEGKYRPENFLRDDIENSPRVSLERFMFGHIRKRLSNYRRNNSRGGKYRILNHLQLHDNINDESSISYDEILFNNELLRQIKSRLSLTPDLLNDFYRMIDEVNLPAQRKNRLREQIHNILVEFGYVEEEN